MSKCIGVEKRVFFLSNFQNKSEILGSQTKYCVQENEEPEEMVDFPKFYKSKNLSCPICSIKCSFEELIMHVKKCIEIQVDNWQKTNYGQCKKCKFCSKHFFRDALAKHMNSCKGNKFKIKFEYKSKKLSNQGDNEKQLDKPEQQLMEHSYSGDKSSIESDALETEGNIFKFSCCKKSRNNSFIRK